MSFVRQARGRRHSALACAAKCSGTSRPPRAAPLGPWPSRPTAWAGSWPHVAQGRALLTADRDEVLHLALAARRPCVMLRAQTGVPAKRARPARTACGQAACKANLGRPPGGAGSPVAASPCRVKEGRATPRLRGDRRGRSFSACAARRRLVMELDISVVGDSRRVCDPRGVLIDTSSLRHMRLCTTQAVMLGCDAFRRHSVRAVLLGCLAWCCSRGVSTEVRYMAERRRANPLCGGRLERRSSGIT